MAQYVDMVPYWMAIQGLELPTWRFAQYTVAINLFGFLAVALLAGSLAERLRSADARLAVASHQIADLRAYNEYVIDSLLSGLVTTDVEGRVLTFNQAAATITGVPVGAGRRPERQRGPAAAADGPRAADDARPDAQPARRPGVPQRPRGASSTSA